MRRPAFSWIAVLCAALAATPALAGGNANFSLGFRSLGDDLWTDIHKQPAFGVSVDFGPESWPIGLVGGYYLSTRQKTGTSAFGVSGDLTGTVGELSFGVRKTWMSPGGAHVFIEGGAAQVIADLKIEGGSSKIEDNDTSAGGYAQVGIFWRLGSRFNIGVQGRTLLGTSVDLNDFGSFGSGNADYYQVGMILGWGWPSS
ncbi:MAG TPA: hypothetical protein VNI57_06410 [Candidatus Saccharimonadales bacterium]|nr:hypothetical protein [Candidatus Saccharimonadales bacterium]